MLMIYIKEDFILTMWYVNALEFIRGNFFNLHFILTMWYVNTTF